MKILKAVLAVFLFLGIVCAAYIVYVFFGYAETDREYGDIHEEYVTEADDMEDPLPDDEASDEAPVRREYDIPERDIDIDGLLAANPDFIGWIYYGDGGVDDQE